MIPEKIFTGNARWLNILFFGVFISKISSKVDYLVADKSASEIFKKIMLKEGVTLSPEQYGVELMKKRVASGTNSKSALTEEQLDALGYIGMPMKVMIYDDAYRGSFEQYCTSYPKPFEGYLLFASSLGKKKENAKAILEARLRPLFTYASNECERLGKLGIITVPRMLFTGYDVELKDEHARMMLEVISHILPLNNIKAVFIDNREGTHTWKRVSSEIIEIISSSTDPKKSPLARPSTFDPKFKDDTHLLFSVVAWRPDTFPYSYPNRNGLDESAKVYATNVLSLIYNMEGTYDKKLRKYAIKDSSKLEAELPPARFVFRGARLEFYGEKYYNSNLDEISYPPDATVGNYTSPTVISAEKPQSLWETLRKRPLLMTIIAMLVLLLLFGLVAWFCMSSRKGQNLRDVDFREHANSGMRPNPPNPIQRPIPFIVQAPPEYQNFGSPSPPHETEKYNGKDEKSTTPLN